MLEPNAAYNLRRERGTLPMEDSVAKQRRRHQRGCLIFDKKRQVYIGRWKEDEVQADGQLKRVYKSKVLGSVQDYATKRLAMRALDKIVSPLNETSYRPKHRISFKEFSDKWSQTILPNHKPSTQASMKSCLKRLNESFGQRLLSEIRMETIQMWTTAQADLSAKTVRNILGTMQLMWKTAKSWEYVDHDPLDGITLPKRGIVARPVLSPEQAKLIIQKADEPFRTMFWVAVETGLRGGELCGLCAKDLDLPGQVINVRQSAWRGSLQTAKTGNAVRTFPISGVLTEHLEGFLTSPNPSVEGLLFCENGKPFDNAEVVRQVFKPICKSLGFDGHRVGLHSLRRASASAMDSLGTPMKIRQHRLGHGDLATTMNYTSANNPDQRTTAEALGQLFNPCGGQDDAILCRQQHEGANASGFQQRLPASTQSCPQGTLSTSNPCGDVEGHITTSVKVPDSLTVRSQAGFESRPQDKLPVERANPESEQEVAYAAGAD